MYHLYMRHQTKIIFEILIFDKIPTPWSQKKGQIPNNLHPSLKFTIERWVNDSITFLEMKDESVGLSSIW